VTLYDSVPPAVWVGTNHFRDYFHQFISEVPDNLVTGALQDVYDKRFIQENIPGRACTNILAMYKAEPDYGFSNMPIEF
jgi:hypothetical protein